ncbi:hypothetical protein [Streptomyces griseoluteus]|uniref:hypothetical protein n=1 Tax=Streptomyces griseoluteus TaxID=29306 RepID=UPI0036F93D57
MAARPRPSVPDGTLWLPGAPRSRQAGASALDGAEGESGDEVPLRDQEEQHGGRRDQEAVESHLRAFFEGHSVEVIDYDLGPERREVWSDLRVLVVGPGPCSDGGAYVTAGCWAAMEKDGHGLEFAMTAHVRDRRFIELMALIAYYHCGGIQLDWEHSTPIGESWVPGSTCDHLLISLPYLHGPDLEHCPVPGGHARAGAQSLEVAGAGGAEMDSTSSSAASC